MLDVFCDWNVYIRFMIIDRFLGLEIVVMMVSSRFTSVHP